jgi:hypothetical protein
MFCNRVYAVCHEKIERSFKTPNGVIQTSWGCELFRDEYMAESNNRSHRNTPSVIINTYDCLPDFIHEPILGRKLTKYANSDEYHRQREIIMQRKAFNNRKNTSRENTSRENTSHEDPSHEDPSHGNTSHKDPSHENQSHEDPYRENKKIET